MRKVRVAPKGMGIHEFVAHDYSLKHVPDQALLPEQLESQRERAARQFQERDYRGSLRYVQLLDDAEDIDGKIIGSHSVGGGESLVVFDALEAAGLRAAGAPRAGRWR